MLLSLVCSILVLVVAVLAGPEPNQEDLHVHLHGLDKVASDAGREKGESTKMNISGEAPETEVGQDYHGGSGGFNPRQHQYVEDDDDGDRIKGGRIASTRDYPFIALLEGCTGSLISTRVVLTATHCFYDEYGRLRNSACGHVVFNSDDKISGNNPLEKKVKIKKIVRFNYDLAAVLLEKKVSLKPVNIALRPVSNGAKVKALGYGMEGFRKGGTYLNEIILKVRYQHNPWEWSKIENRWIRWKFIETNVGPNDEGPCSGDSGGPLLVWRNGQYELLATLWGGGYDCRKNTMDIDRMGDRWNKIIGSGLIRVFRGRDIRKWANGQYNCK